MQDNHGASIYRKEDLPHGVAVTGIDDKFMYLSSPADARQKKRRIGLSALQEFIGYHGDQ